jgi:hypothetical protein
MVKQKKSKNWQKGEAGGQQFLAGCENLSIEGYIQTSLWDTIIGAVCLR